MEKSFNKMLSGYQQFRKKYAEGDASLMQELSETGQSPEFMVVACSDSRVDPAILLQCQPGDLFVVRNVANLIPPFESDGKFHGTSAALEYGICYLNVEHLIILGHSQCGGISAKLSPEVLHQDDFISHWVSIADMEHAEKTPDQCAQASLINSYNNCLTFPWIKQRLDKQQLAIHLWFFDIESGRIKVYDKDAQAFYELG